MFRLYPKEEFREIQFENPATYRYAVSNFGRAIKFTDSVEDGELVNAKKNNSYQMLTYTVKIDGKSVKKSACFYRLIANLFLEKASDEQVHVLHLDHDRRNDHISNLKWATRAEMVAHHQTSPHVIARKQNRKLFPNRKKDGRKLTMTQVMLLKKRLLDPNRKTRLKILAKQYGVSEMQLHRIRRGENWGHIKVDVGAAEPEPELAVEE